MTTQDDVNTPMIAFIGLAFTILTFALILGVQVLYYHFERVEYQRKVVEVPFVDSDSLIAAQEAKLNRYAWIDRKSGKASIPIARAMELVVRELRDQQEQQEIRDENSGGG